MTALLLLALLGLAGFGGGLYVLTHAIAMPRRAAWICVWLTAGSALCAAHALGALVRSA